MSKLERAFPILREFADKSIQIGDERIHVWKSLFGGKKVKYPRGWVTIDFDSKEILFLMFKCAEGIKLERLFHYYLFFKTHRMTAVMRTILESMKKLLTKTGDGCNLFRHLREFETKKIHQLVLEVRKAAASVQQGDDFDFDDELDLSDEKKKKISFKVSDFDHAITVELLNFLVKKKKPIIAQLKLKMPVLVTVLESYSALGVKYHEDFDETRANNFHQILKQLNEERKNKESQGPNLLLYCDENDSEEREIRVHRLVLALFSNYFVSKFEENLDDLKEMEDLKVEELDFETLEVFVEMLYSSECRCADWRILMKLVEHGCKYQEYSCLVDDNSLDNHLYAMLKKMNKEEVSDCLLNYGYIFAEEHVKKFGQKYIKTMMENFSKEGNEFEKLIQESVKQHNLKVEIEKTQDRCRNLEVVVQKNEKRGKSNSRELSNMKNGNLIELTLLTSQLRKRVELLEKENEDLKRLRKKERTTFQTQIVESGERMKSIQEEFEEMKQERVDFMKEFGEMKKLLSMEIRLSLKYDWSMLQLSHDIDCMKISQNGRTATHIGRGGEDHRNGYALSKGLAKRKGVYIMRIRCDKCRRGMDGPMTMMFAKHSDSSHFIGIIGGKDETLDKCDNGYSVGCSSAYGWYQNNERRVGGKQDRVKATQFFGTGDVYELKLDLDPDVFLNTLSFKNETTGKTDSMKIPKRKSWRLHVYMYYKGDQITILDSFQTKP